MAVDTGLELGFRDVDTEHVGRSLSVEGALPDWLDGALIRNGPGRFSVGGQRVSHWFDGLAMLTRYGFDGAADAVTYTNRFLRSDTYRRAIEDGRLDAQFATTEGGWLRRLWDLVFAEPTDNCNVHVARFGGDWVAMTEVPRYVAFDPGDLTTEGAFTFEDELSGTVNCAHVVPDPHRGETVGLLADYRDRCYRIYRVSDGQRRRELVAELDAAKPAYLHSFALAPDHVVLTEHPFTTDPRSFLTPGGEGFLDFFDWHPGQGTRFRIVDRATGDEAVATTSDAPFVFHHANAFADGGDIVVDLVAYPDPGVADGLSLDRVADWFQAGVDGELRRYRVPADGGAVTAETLHDAVQLPRIAAGDRTHRHRYVFGQGAGGADATPLVKVDCRTGTVARWREVGTFAEEPLFVRAPDADPPDDAGVVLATALDTDAERTVLLVLDAKTLEERARATVPHAVPFGFHGRYVR